MKATSIPVRTNLLTYVIDTYDVRSFPTGKVNAAKTPPAFEGESRRNRGHRESYESAIICDVVYEGVARLWVKDISVFFHSAARTLLLAAPAHSYNNQQYPLHR